MVQKNNMPSSSSANTNSTSLFEEETVCPIPTDENAATNGSEVIEDQPRRVRYNWDAKQKGQVLGSYFIGYTVTQLPGAWAGRRYGHIKILTISFFTAGLLTCLLPYVMLQLRDDAAVKFFIFMRVLVGFLQGCCYPTFMALWGSWAPKSELSRLVSIQFAGAGIGIAIMYPVNGWLAVELGWQFIFYFTGTIAMIFSAALGYCCCDTPAEHDTISQEELTLIMSDKKETSNERHVIPWKSILTSVPIWAIVIAHTAGNFGTYVMTSYMPSYLDEQLHYNIKSAAIFSAIPALIKPAMTMISGVLSDFLVTHMKMRTIVVRKIMSTVGLCTAGFSIALAGHVGCNAVVIVFLLSISLSFDGVTTSGFKANHVEIAPGLSGITYAMANTFGSLPGFIGPAITGLLLASFSGVTGWFIVFWLTAIIYFIGALAFLVFGTSETQSWAKSDDNKNSLQRLNSANDEF
ncbi:unnamed protein product [Oikopleura dioica]|uniref:Major facilitator superfamily (MFS) profile domain-containing protein n=1 Tax=Oikopleura dioica TaxID=34765 RepID=E4X8B2_OIKDI|nr:unnamed protein product [Oikopleura dioica]